MIDQPLGICPSYMMLFASYASTIGKAYLVDKSPGP